jgi:signal transduction histidine kinase
MVRGFTNSFSTFATHYHKRLMFLINQIKYYWHKITNVGVTDSLSFAQRRKTRLLNGMAVVGGSGTVFYMLFTLFMLPAGTTLTAIDPFYYLNFILIFTFAFIVFLHSVYYYTLAKCIGLVFTILFYTYVGFFSGKPYEGEMFLVVIAIFIFIMFDKNKFIIPLFLLCFACFIFLLVNIAQKNEAVFGYIIDAGVYVRIFTLFVFLYFALNFFRFEYWNYQQEIEEKNKALQDKNNEIIAQSEILEAQAHELSKLNQTKDKLFSIIGHDLRTPIAGIKSMLNIFEEENMSKDGFDSFANLLKINVDNTYQMLENLLEWSKSQMQGITHSPTSIDLTQIMNEKIRLFSEVAHHKNITINNHLSPNIFAYADHNQVRLILRNLLTNAIKFTSKGGEITISALSSSEFITICIQDSGIGMNPNQIKNLFSLPMVLSQSGTEGEHGTGLGLLLIKEFVGNNGGKVWVESEEGKGSSFFFTLQKLDTLSFV